MRTTFNTLICLNGELPGEEFFREFDGRILAADGAALTLAAMGIRANMVIGDMDSLTLREARTIADEVVYSAEQDTNDFEKIFLHAKPEELQGACICGFHGGELEHTLNNWSVLMRYGKSHSPMLYDKGRLAVPVYETFTLAAEPNEIISLIPQPHARITTEGLQWALTNEELRLGSREGARNRAADTTVRIDVHDGALLVFYDAHRS